MEVGVALGVMVGVAVLLGEAVNVALWLGVMVGVAEEVLVRAVEGGGVTLGIGVTPGAQAPRTHASRGMISWRADCFIGGTANSGIVVVKDAFQFSITSAVWAGEHTPNDSRVAAELPAFSFLAPRRSSPESMTVRSFFRFLSSLVRMMVKAYNSNPNSKNYF